MSLNLRRTTLLCLLLSVFLANAWGATWTPLNNPPPNSTDEMMLLPDGTVMLQINGGSPSWLRLTPDASGSYINGTFDATSISPMSTNRLWYSSEVLPNGNVWLVGGEYYGPHLDQVDTATGEVWNATTNTWSPTALFPAQACGGDTFNIMANTTSGSKVITNIPTAITPTFLVGWTVSGPGIPAGATISSIVSSSQVQISAPATATAAQVTLVFSGTPTACHGDLPSMLLPGGQILNGSLVDNSTFLYNIASNSWSDAASKVYNIDASDEEGWVKLPDGRVLTYDINQSINAGAGYAEIYDPAANTWSSISPSDGTANGTLPLLTSVAVGNEIGPVLRLLDGRIFQVGANGATALYTPSTNTWAPGPNMVGSINGIPALFGADDAPAAVLPNGHVILSGDAVAAAVNSSGDVTSGSSAITNIPSTATLYPGWMVAETDAGSVIPANTTITSVDSPTQVTISNAATGSAAGVTFTFGGTYSPPVEFFDFDPVANTISLLSPALPDAATLNQEGVYTTTMLMLPNGQLLVNDGSSLWIYTPDGTAAPQYQPVTTSVAYNGNGVFTLTGTQITGQNAGATFGDDVEMDENYPIVSLVSSSGNVYYCRASNWSTVAVATGTTPETVNFKLNPAITAGNYSLVVSAAGIQSAATPITITTAEINGQTTNPSDSISGQVTLSGSPFAGVTVSLSTGANTVTNASGDYSFPNLTSATSYTVTPSQNGYQFSPANMVITTTNSGNQTANFAAAAVTGGNTLGFIPITPCRVIDTRSSNGSLGGPILASGSTRSFPLPMGSCGIPAGASAYSLNVTVVPESKLNYLTLWPTGQTQPVVSTLNSLNGRVVANAAIVPAGTNGDISIYVTDQTQVIIDVNGYFGPSGSAGALSFVPVTPCRMEDTRNANGPFGGPILAASSTRNFVVPSSACSIPSTAAAYSLNETVVPTSTLQYLTLYPAGAAQPNVSTLNSYTGGVVANAAIVPAGTGGAITAYVTDQTQLISDINGYFTSTASTNLGFNTVPPCRVVDTRKANGTFGGPIVAANSTRTFPLPTGSCGIPSTAAAYALNVTVVPTSTLNYLTLWPAGQSQPLVSTVNSPTGQIVANAALVPAGSSGGVSVYVTNQTQVIIDIVGYFSAQ